MAKSLWKSDLTLTGENIRKYRKNANMTQAELAEEIGGAMNNRVISRYENGKCEMGIQTFFDIAEALHVDPGKLVPDRLRESADPRKNEIAEMFSELDEEGKEIAFQGIKAMLAGLRH